MPEGSRAQEIEQQRLALSSGLRQLRQARGKTQNEVGDRTGVDRSAVSRAEQGKLLPKREFWDAADRFLKGQGALLRMFDAVQRLQTQAADAVVAAIAAADHTPVAGGSPSRLDEASLNPVMLTGSVHRRPPVHPKLLDHLEALTSGYRYLDYQDGAQAVTAEVTAHLTRLLALGDTVPPALHRRYHLAVGDAAQLAAWLAIDRQDYVLARQLCGTALVHATEADDSDLHAYVLGIMGYMHLHRGRGREALQVLHRGAHVATHGHSHADPAVQSWLHEAIGEAHALIGARAEGAKALVQAERLFDSVDPAQVPRWLGFYDNLSHLARLRGRCLMRLGDGRRAIAALEEARALLPDHYVREHSGALIDLAAAHLLPGVEDPVAAVLAAGEAHDLAVLTRSGRNVARVRELAQTLHPYRQLPEVKALTAALG